MSRVALVTGSSGGIGAAICKRLEGDGLDVLGVDLSVDQSGAAVSADLATPEGNRAAVDAALERHGRLDAIVPNAGFQHVAPVAEFPEERWDALLALLL
ncbi:MAG: SDR family NAD(P)-dependent oxidoreductase, partial [Solirubrobacteraceae bacterium]